jgi:hypothetical protein
MTAQEVFDTVATHLLTQGRKALSDDKQCAYRAPNGDKCAVGCLIPDDKYVPKMEGKGVDFLLAEFKLVELEPHMGLLLVLQDTHDRRALEDWPTRLVQVAQMHGLSYDAVLYFKKA